MKKYLFLFVIMLSALTYVPNLVFGQTGEPSLIWQKEMPVDVSTTEFALTVTADNHYIVISEYQSVAFQQYITYLDSQGNIIWQKNLNRSTDHNMHFNNCVELNDQSGFIVAFLDSLLIFDYQGNIVNEISVPTQQDELSVYKDQNYYYVTEASNRTTTNNVFVYDNNLNLVRTFPVLVGIKKIVTTGDYLYVANDANGGGVHSNASVDLSKYDVSGNLIWTRHVPDMILSNCALGNDGDVYLVGTKLIWDKPGQIWELTKFNASGDSLWTRRWYGDYPVGPVWLGLWTNDLVDLPTGGCIILGSATQLGQDITSPHFDPNLTEPMAISYDSNGNMSWKMRLLPTARGRFMQGSLDTEKYLIAYGDYDRAIRVFKFSLPGITSVEKENSEIPRDFSLSQNYPNPFNPSTTINFSIVEYGFVSLKIYDLLGREVATLVNEELGAGTYSTKFDAGNLASGVYVYRITAKNFASTKKMMLVK